MHHYIQVYSAPSPTACPCPAKSPTASSTKPAHSPPTRSVSCDGVYILLYDHTIWLLYTILHLYICHMHLYIFIYTILTHVHVYIYTRTLL